MSVTDYRKLIDLHSGDFIGVECVDGLTIELSINGDAVKMNTQLVAHIASQMRKQMKPVLEGGTFLFGIKGHGERVKLNYFDAGAVLDAILGAVKFLA